MDSANLGLNIVLVIALAVLVVGTGRRIVRYWRVPAPLKIPTTPAPATRLGVTVRMAREVLLFESLFKASRWTWLFGWVFHAALLLVLIGHLRLLIDQPWAHLFPYQIPGRYAAAALLLGLIGLWIRRFAVARVRYISSPSDHLMLALLGAIAGTGMVMRHFSPTDVGAVARFIRGLLGFDWQPLPDDLLLWAHVLMAALLALVLPFSKLLHAPGVFFSPTRNQADDARERRHVNPWAPD